MKTEILLLVLFLFEKTYLAKSQSWLTEKINDLFFNNLINYLFIKFLHLL